MRKILISAASLALVLGGVGLAPIAMASNESVQVSSLTSGAQPSGIVSQTVVGGGNAVGVRFPTSLVTATTWAGSDLASCANLAGVTVSVNGVPRTISYCYSGLNNSYYILSVVVSPAMTNGDLVTLTWQSGYLTNLASLQGGTIGVQDGMSYSQVTPTSIGGGSSATSTPILMWQQAIGRESATAACPAGYTGSWDTWPNGGKGGSVCNKFVPTYGN